ncbi:hypothetical protein [Pseudomonas taiwanensis]|uniref:Uncharacterized protein n=1 Tax=Pseudomonas taiwanensis TaxID=470150 RepID=A0ABR6VD31_9PSED|nr:hypothetical protein [Pseudomonas taiwanensis]MBC3478030.1 hypothetical protein [Pseudomonas taiwanensis]
MEDFRLSSDNYSSQTEKSSTSYLDCVSTIVSGRNETFINSEDGKTLLFIDSADPLKASGMVELFQVGGVNKINAYQRAARYDKGALFDAARARSAN